MRVIAASVCVTAMLGLAACGGEKTDATASDASVPDATYTSPAAPPTETMPPPATITPEGMTTNPDGAPPPSEPAPGAGSGGAPTTP